MHAQREKMKRAQGLCTNSGRTDSENAEIITTILAEYLDGEPLQSASRSADDWQHCHDLPTDFNRRYRYAQ